MSSLISAASILDIILALIVQHSEPLSKVSRANTLYNFSLALIKDLLA